MKSGSNTEVLIESDWNLKYTVILNAAGKIWY